METTNVETRTAKIKQLTEARVPAANGYYYNFPDKDRYWTGPFENRQDAVNSATLQL